MQPILFFAAMALLTGLVYPLAVTAVVQIAFPNQSNGSLISNHQTLVGSKLIAQATHDPKYFYPRPSASDYNAVPSSASNLAPTDPLFPKDPLATKSASGLDPDISLIMARAQIPRIAAARNIPEAKLEAMIEQSSSGTINVLMANLELDQP